MAIASGAAGIYSDDFAGSTFPETTPGWAKINETGGATITREGFNTSDARAVFTLPSGTAYEQWTTQGGVCLEQTCTDSDFTLEAKFDTLPSVNGQEVGMYVINSDDSIGVVCGFFYDSGALTAWAAEFINHVTYNSTAFTATAPAWARMGWNTTTNTLSFAWSDTGAFGGEQTTDSASLVFTPTHVGIYAGTFDSGGIPAWIGKVDYLFETSAVISPEDAVTGGTRRIFIIT